MGFQGKWTRLFFIFCQMFAIFVEFSNFRSPLKKQKIWEKLKKCVIQLALNYFSTILPKPEIRVSGTRILIPKIQSLQKNRQTGVLFLFLGTLPEYLFSSLLYSLWRSKKTCCDHGHQVVHVQHAELHAECRATGRVQQEISREGREACDDTAA